MEPPPNISHYFLLASGSFLLQATDKLAYALKIARVGAGWWHSFPSPTSFFSPGDIFFLLDLHYNIRAPFACYVWAQLKVIDDCVLVILTNKTKQKYTWQFGYLVLSNLQVYVP